MKYKVGDKIIRFWRGFRNETEQHEGTIVEITEEHIVADFLLDSLTQITFNRKTGINVNGKEYGWIDLR